MRRPLRVWITNTVVLNGGDAAILEATLPLLRDAFGEGTRFLAYAPQPGVARKYFPSLEFRRPLPHHLGASAPRWSRAAIARAARKARLYVAAWCFGRRLGALTRWWLPARQRGALEEFASADVIVSAGGTYLVENYPLEPRIVDYRLALLARRPLILFAQSLGPFEQPRNRRTLGRVLRRARLILLRDERSREHLRELSIPADRIAVSADPVFALATEDACAPEPSRRGEVGSGSSGSNRRLRIAVSVRYWPYFEREKAGNRRYRGAVAALVGSLVRDAGAHVTFVSTCQGVPEYWTDDSRVAARIAKTLPADVRAEVTVDREHRSPGELLDLLGGFDLVVATRMHAAILALCAGTPVFPIAYEFKTRELFERLGLGDWVEDIEDVSEASLPAAVGRFLEALPDLRRPLSERVARERDRALATGALVADALSR